jgi:hypothetical protein
MKPINPLRYVLAYVLWFFTIGLGFLTADAARVSVRSALIVAELDRYFIHANSLIIVLLLGMVSVAFMVVTEHLYRTAVPKNKLISRFAQVTGWTLIVLAVMHLLHAVTIYVDSSLFPWFRLSATAIEFVGGIAFLWLSRRLSTKPVLVR